MESVGKRINVSLMSRQIRTMIELEMLLNFKASEKYTTKTISGLVIKNIQSKVFVKMDRSRLLQIIGNLITQYTHRYFPVRVDLRKRDMEPVGHLVSAKVHDAVWDSSYSWLRNHVWCDSAKILSNVFEETIRRAIDASIYEYHDQLWRNLII